MGTIGPWAGPRLGILGSQCSSSCHLCQLPRGAGGGGALGAGLGHSGHRARQAARTGGGSARTWRLQAPHCTQRVHTGREVQAAQWARLPAQGGQRTKAWTEGGHRGNAAIRAGEPLSIPQMGTQRGWQVALRGLLTAQPAPRGSVPPARSSGPPLRPPRRSPRPQSFRPGNRFAEKAAQAWPLTPVLSQKLEIELAAAEGCEAG